MRSIAGLVICSGFLASCGGGGGDAGGPPQVQLLAINSSNQQAVGRATATAMTSLVGAGGGIAGSSSTTGTASAMALPTATSGYRGGSLNSLAMLMVRSATGTIDGRRSALSARVSGGAARAQTVGSLQTQCSVSGSVTLSVSDADNSGTPSVGDTMTLTFSQCRETATDSLDGAMAIKLTQLSIVNDAVASLAGTLSMQHLSATDGVRTALLDGSLSMAFSQLSASEGRTQLTVGSSGLGASVSGGGVSDAVSFEPGFALDMTETMSTTIGGVDTSTATLTGGFSATSIAGRVVLETSVPVLQWATEAYPRSGTVRVVGNASALRLQALSATTVRIELDGNLDGTYELSTDLPWTTLLPG